MVQRNIELELSVGHLRLSLSLQAKRELQAFVSLPDDSIGDMT